MNSKDFRNIREAKKLLKEAEKRKGSKNSLEMAMKVDKVNIEGFIKAVSDYASYGRELEDSLKDKMPELGLKLLKISEDALYELDALGEEWREAEEKSR